MQRRLLIGTYECSLDDRFRLAVPAKLRDHFADGATVSWWLDDCLVLAPGTEWDALIERTFGSLNVLNDKQRFLRRYLLAGAFPTDALDKQGRLVIPAKLREHAGLGAKVTVIGAGEYLEVWDPARLDARFGDLEREGVSSVASRLAEGMG
ncbi:MAG: cell division/cell wall cluster transcriptional repressor MraZ [Actinomycetota bacterium]